MDDTPWSARDLVAAFAFFRLPRASRDAALLAAQAVATAEAREELVDLHTIVAATWPDLRKPPEPGRADAVAQSATRFVCLLRDLLDPANAPIERAVLDGCFTGKAASLDRILLTLQFGVTWWDGTPSRDELRAASAG